MSPENLRGEYCFYIKKQNDDMESIITLISKVKFRHLKEISCLRTLGDVFSFFCPYRKKFKKHCLRLTQLRNYYLAQEISWISISNTLPLDSLF